MANLFQALAGESAASTSSKKACYDVFINHYGKDVKRTLASTIYNMLDLVGVQVFLDQPELEVGDAFPAAIEEAMRSASVHIAIFSPGYAESPWCLEELLLMLQIKATIIPVFYGVDTSDLRHDKGKYADAFVKHKEKGRHSLEKIEKWKEALKRVSNLTGRIVDPLTCDEGKLSREIMESALHNMRKPQLEVAKFPVGLDEAVQDFESKVGSSTGSENVHIVGIFGMGGSGKTTLAKELFNRKLSSISRSSFLSNVRHAASANNLPSLQKQLLKDLRIQHSEFHNIHEGKTLLDKDLRSMTVLIVLDDVDDVDQMDALCLGRDNLGRGSFIIVTTRDIDVLTTWGISYKYPMKLLNSFNANQLFCTHAFLSLDKYDHNFQDLIKRFVEACKGLPLSLKVLGAMVCCRPRFYWESLLGKISTILPGKITECLKLSYEALDSQVQQMFLDITCFFVGKERSLVTTIWDGLGWSGELGLETLVDKCLVELDEEDCIQIHDHLRDLGRGIAKDFSPSRIWNEEQINNQGEKTQVRGIVLDGMTHCWPTLKHCMENIRFLAARGNDSREEFVALSRQLVWLCWCDFNRTNLPLWLSFENLIVLELHGVTNLQELWQDDVQPPLQLRVLIIDIISGTSFGGLPRSIGRLRHLKKLVFEGNDSGMRSLPEEFGCLESLEFLQLSGFQVSLLPDSFGKLTNLRRLILKRIQLRALPDSFGELQNLERLVLEGNELTALPDSFGELRNLKSLVLWGHQLTALPESFGELRNLKSLELYGEQLTALPDSFGELRNLESLRLQGHQLTALPDSFGELRNLKTLVLWGRQLTALPDSFGELRNLKTLVLSGHQLTALPDSFGELRNLGSLYLVRVQLRVESLWGCNLKSLKTLTLGETLGCRMSISDDCCPRLELLRLSANYDLTEIETLPRNVKAIEVYECPKLRSMSAIGGLLNLERLVVDGCPDLEVLPCPRYMPSAGREITETGCPKAERQFQDLGIERG